MADQETVNGVGPELHRQEVRTQARQAQADEAARTSAAEDEAQAQEAQAAAEAREQAAEDEAAEAADQRQQEASQQPPAGRGQVVNEIV
ncbi:MAG: hypothetical protein JRC92_12495 [Deltaproteobacteria bacterium]|nr:hypothetical protein [Deltaproteobacteria bacterium]